MKKRWHSIIKLKKNQKLQSYGLKLLDSVIAAGEKRIHEGLSEPYAGTGTPKKKLRGGALFMSQMASIGGGTKKNGGGGVEEGMRVLSIYERARGIKSGVQRKLSIR